MSSSEFEKGKILGVDYGEKRIGLAIAGVDVKVATPLTILNVDEEEEYLSQLDDIVLKRGVELIVVGHPVSLSGSKTESTLRAEEFAEVLDDRYDIDVVLWDERLTTREIEKNVIKRLSRDGYKKASNRIKSGLDALSASLILQSYLESLENISEG